MHQLWKTTYKSLLNNAILPHINFHHCILGILGLINNSIAFSKEEESWSVKLCIVQLHCLFSILRNLNGAKPVETVAATALKAKSAV